PAFADRKCRSPAPLLDTVEPTVGGCKTFGIFDQSKLRLSTSIALATDYGFLWQRLAGPYPKRGEGGLPARCGTMTVEPAVNSWAGGTSRPGAQAPLSANQLRCLIISGIAQVFGLSGRPARKRAEEHRLGPRMGKINITDAQRLLCESASGPRVGQSFHGLEQFLFIFTLDEFCYTRVFPSPLNSRAILRAADQQGKPHISIVR